jgi:hypothetical protein
MQNNPIKIKRINPTLFLPSDQASELASKMSSYVSTNWRGTSQTPDNGPRAKCDQVVFEAIAKAAEIIVASRGGAPDQNSLSSNSSSRFNLQVPEIPGVRSILQRSRRALHVPLRLDVYYQHDDQGERRELLERWCLEYVPCRLETFLEREGTLTQDPIAQLRHVCKRIVIWLRTLYCWSRLLPAQAFRSASSNSNSNHNPIGFSVYVVSDGSDDVSDLVRNQGFLSQQQPSSVVTPYGELGWRAIYVDKSVVERLLPSVHAFKSPLWAPRLTSTARPIPIQKASNGAERSPNASTTSRAGNNDRGMLVPQSAPAHFADQEWHTEIEQDVQHQDQDQNHHQHQQQQQSHDPSFLFRRSNSTITRNPHHLHDGPDLQRRNTTLGDERPSPPMSSNHSTPVAIKTKPPARVMSGLSLALEMIDCDDRGDANSGWQMPTPALTPTPSSDLSATAEKRRAALHQMPPHYLVEQQQQQHHQQQQQQQAAASPGASRKNQHQRPSAQGEYGYAYNNHIPWQRIHPSSTNPTQGRSPGDFFDGRSLSTSPSALASTPPGAAFLGVGMTPPLSAAHFIPPRSAVTPPFAPRPTALSQEPPVQPLTHMADQADQGGRTRYGDTANPNVLPPMASLDLLHSSPFQHAQGSLVSSLSLAPLAGADSVSAMMMNSGDLRRSMWSAAGTSAIDPSYPTQDEDYEEMPFAVDESSSSQAAFNMNTSQLGASAAVASFAQKCAPSNRLKMFDHQSITAAEPQQPPGDDNGDGMMNSLADQLAEFRSFGASLQVSATGSGSEHDQGASSSTPISLRT